MDSSEAIRPKDIMQVVEERLNVVACVYTGGTLLHPLLADIASNFEGNEDADTVLRLLILFERILIEKEILPSDYVFCMAKKKITGESSV
jgi:hypothetical protein